MQSFFIYMLNALKALLSIIGNACAQFWCTQKKVSRTASIIKILGRFQTLQQTIFFKTAHAAFDHSDTLANYPRPFISFVSFIQEVFSSDIKFCVAENEEKFVTLENYYFHS